MINIEAQRAKFISSFCKATGINSFFAEEVFSYIDFHNELNDIAGYFSDNDSLDFMVDDEGELHKVFSGENGVLTLEETYKLYKEIVGLGKRSLRIYVNNIVCKQAKLAYLY